MPELGRRKAVTSLNIAFLEIKRSTGRPDVKVDEMEALQAREVLRRSRGRRSPAEKAHSSLQRFRSVGSRRTLSQDIGGVAITPLRSINPGQEERAIGRVPGQVV